MPAYAGSSRKHFDAGLRRLTPAYTGFFRPEAGLRRLTPASLVFPCIPVYSRVFPCIPVFSRYSRYSRVFPCSRHSLLCRPT